jgi:L-alanine-DL-glutamate epimerase-like enolase superfamily enzyme
LSVRISSVETRTYRYPLDPPFAAAWDPVPRAVQEATLVIVHGDGGDVGYASGGDGLPDAALLDRLLRGVDAEDTDRVHGVCETVDFHGGRPWAVEIACWDLVGRVLGEPLWKLLGGRQERLTAYASTGELLEPADRADRARALAARGVRAIKLRFHHPDWRTDMATVAAVRDAVGDDVELMVDANQGWRMPGDLTPRWDVETAAACAGALEEHAVHWLEEPLPTDHPEAYRELRDRTSVRLAAGEMVRTAGEARDLVLRGRIDVLQCDVLFCGGFTGSRRLAELADANGADWSPHTWSNGYGLVANLHAACAFSAYGYVEVPFDPPAWSAERRDWLLPAPVEIAADGTIAPPPGPGLGIEPDLDALEQWRVA